MREGRAREGHGVTAGTFSDKLWVLFHLVLPHDSQWGDLSVLTPFRAELWHRCVPSTLNLDGRWARAGTAASAKILLALQWDGHPLCAGGKPSSSGTSSPSQGAIRWEISVCGTSGGGSDRGWREGALMSPGLWGRGAPCQGGWILLHPSMEERGTGVFPVVL